MSPRERRRWHRHLPRRFPWIRGRIRRRRTSAQPSRAVVEPAQRPDLRLSENEKGRSACAAGPFLFLGLPVVSLVLRAPDAELRDAGVPVAKGSARSAAAAERAKTGCRYAARVLLQGASLA